MSFSEYFDPAVDIYSIYTLLVLSIRRKYPRQGTDPCIQCLAILLTTEDPTTSCSSVVWVLHMLGLLSLPILITHHDGDTPFFTIILLKIYMVITSPAIGLHDTHVRLLLYACMVLIALSTTHVLAIRETYRKVFYFREIAIVNIGHMRKLTRDDIWKIPERFRINTMCDEFQYDTGERFFFIKAVARSAWKPLVYLSIADTIFGVFSLYQAVLMGRILGYIESPKTHSWYSVYFYLTAWVVISIINSQTDRLSSIREAEITRIAEFIKFRLFQINLNTPMRKHKHLYNNRSWLISNSLNNFDNVLGQFKYIVRASLSFWITYNEIGWCVLVPTIVNIGVSALCWFITFLSRKFHTPKYTCCNGFVDEICDEIRPIKFFSLEPIYLTRAQESVSKNWGDTKTWKDIINGFIKWVVGLINIISDDLAVLISVKAYLGSGSTLSGASLIQLPRLIERTNNDLQDIYSGLSVISDLVDFARHLENGLSDEQYDATKITTDISHNEKSRITLDSCTFVHHGFSIPNITLDSSGDELVIVNGQTGSGKTTLILALCGEIRLKSGSAHTYGKVGYVEQSPWIMNDTLRTNIIFGHEYDAEYYQKVIEACALAQDIEAMPGGDLTEIGYRGINLSGGQKARVSLARAIYSRADVYLLDDPLSAVDAHVERHILDNALMPGGLVGDKLRVIVTNSEHILPVANTIVQMNGAREPYIINQIPATFCPISSLQKTQSKPSSSDIEIVLEITDNDTDTKKNLGKLIDSSEDEKLPKSALETIKYFYNMFGARILFISITTSLIKSASTYICEGLRINLIKSLNNLGENNAELIHYLTMKIYFSVFDTITSDGFRILNSMIYQRGFSVKITRLFVQSLLRAPVSFFDTTPTRDVENTYADIVDDLIYELPWFIKYYCGVVFDTILTTYRILTISSQLLFVTPIGVFLNYRVGKWINKPEDDISRINKSVMSEYEKNIRTIEDGKTNIRMLRSADYFLGIHTNSMDNATGVSNMSESVSSLGIMTRRLISLASEYVTSLLMIIQIQATRTKLGTGEFDTFFNVSQTLQTQLSVILNICSLSKMYLNSASLLWKYTNLPQEAPLVAEGLHLPENWPTNGKIECRNLSMRYRDNLGLALHDISFTVMPGEKIGIVGRTGSGKSSLIQCLFRLLEPASGTILIDDQDITKIGLNDLRTQIGIIPQIPNIFTGTIRKNIDPFNKYNIEELWAAIIKAQCSEFASKKIDVDSDSDDDIENIQKWWMRLIPNAIFKIFSKDKEPTPRGLNKHLNRYHSGASAGEKQLLSLCRALLCKKKILVLDEATANIDANTDKAIQRVIRDEFKDCTILTIAHRINTIMNSDKILFMSNGQVAEFDTPQALLSRGGMFADLVNTLKLTNESVEQK